MPGAFWFAVALASAAFFAFLSVVVWLGERTKEREAQYRNESVKKLSETGGSADVMEYLREAERVDAHRTRTKARLAGLITTAVSVALMIFFKVLVDQPSVYLVGLLPLLVGGALLIASDFMIKPAK